MESQHFCLHGTPQRLTNWRHMTDSSEGEREARGQKEENYLNAEEWLNPDFQL